MCAATVAAAYPTSVSGKTACVANGVVSYQGSVTNTEKKMEQSIPVHHVAPLKICRPVSQSTEPVGAREERGGGILC